MGGSPVIHHSWLGQPQRRGSSRSESIDQSTDPSIKPQIRQNGEQKDFVAERERRMNEGSDGISELEPSSVSRLGASSKSKIASDSTPQDLKTRAPHIPHPAPPKIAFDGEQELKTSKTSKGANLDELQTCLLMSRRAIETAKTSPVAKGLEIRVANKRECCEV